MILDLMLEGIGTGTDVLNDAEQDIHSILRQQ
jgi:hypothetical protein